MTPSFVRLRQDSFFSVEKPSFGLFISLDFRKALTPVFAALTRFHGASTKPTMLATRTA
jgi:hypothetical protein